MLVTQNVLHGFSALLIVVDAFRTKTRDTEDTAQVLPAQGTRINDRKMGASEIRMCPAVCAWR